MGLQIYFFLHLPQNKNSKINEF